MKELDDIDEKYYVVGKEAGEGAGDANNKNEKQQDKQMIRKKHG